MLCSQALSNLGTADGGKERKAGIYGHECHWSASEEEKMKVEDERWEMEESVGEEKEE